MKLRQPIQMEKLIWIALGLCFLLVLGITQRTSISILRHKQVEHTGEVPERLTAYVPDHAGRLEAVMAEGIRCEGREKVLCWAEDSRVWLCSRTQEGFLGVMVREVYAYAESSGEDLLQDREAYEQKASASLWLDGENNITDLILYVE